MLAVKMPRHLPKRSDSGSSSSKCAFGLSLYPQLWSSAFPILRTNNALPPSIIHEICESSHPQPAKEPGVEEWDRIGSRQPKEEASDEQKKKKKKKTRGTPKRAEKVVSGGVRSGARVEKEEGNKREMREMRGTREEN